MESLLFSVSVLFEGMVSRICLALKLLKHFLGTRTHVRTAMGAVVVEVAVTGGA